MPPSPHQRHPSGDAEPEPSPLSVLSAVLGTRIQKARQHPLQDNTVRPICSLKYTLDHKRVPPSGQHLQTSGSHLPVDLLWSESAVIYRQQLLHCNAKEPFVLLQAGVDEYPVCVGERYKVTTVEL